MALKLKINGELEAFTQTLAWLGGLNVSKSDPKTLHAIMTLATKRIVQDAKKALERGYAVNSGMAHTRGTLLTYKKGKHPGQQWSFRRPWPQATTGKRSGAIAKSLVIKPLSGKTFVGHKVEVNPSANYTGFAGSGDDTDMGKPLWWIASQLENPRPSTLVIPKTRRMQVYLMLLYNGAVTGGRTAGEGTPRPKRHLLNYMVGGTVVIQKRPVKIWKKTFDALVAKVPSVMQNQVHVSIERVCQASRQNLRFGRQSWHASKP